MITITSRKELQHQTAKYVYVEREKTLYILEEEYVIKRYFTVQEAQQILQTKYFTVHRLLIRLGMRATFSGKRIRINIRQLMKMAQILRLTKE